MSEIFNGRYTAKTDRPFVVFLIGMRVNRWWRLDKWIPVLSAMGPMLKTLFTNPEKGFLHAEFFWNLNGPGRSSIRRSARMEAWASGMKPTRWIPTNSRASMLTCRALGSRGPWST